MVIGAILMTGVSVTVSLFIVNVAVLPLLFKYSKFVQRKIVFSNCINYPRNLDYDHPSSCDVIGGRNFSVEFNSVEDDCPLKLGAWHIVPCSMFHDVFALKDVRTIEKRLHEELKVTDRPIILYCHGNANHRASPHRLQMYKVFQELNFHVITFDYRGYGDSTQIRPTEAGVVEDVLHMYAWILDNVNQTKRPKIIIWGHSLGTAVASNLVANLETLCQRYARRKPLPQPDGLVLESAFNNLCNEIQCHPFSKLVSWLPYYEHTFLKPFKESPDYAFKTDQYLSSVPEVPLLLLHSRGDKIVPYELAEKLHCSVLQSRADGGAPVVMHPFSRSLGLGHNNVCEAENLPTVIQGFLQIIDYKKSAQLVSSETIN